MINNETLYKASYKKSSLMFVFFYLEVYFPFMSKFVFPITSFLNKLFLFVIKKSLFLAYFINLILYKFIVKLLFLFNSKNKNNNFTHYTYNLNIVYSLVSIKNLMVILNEKIINKIKYFKGTLNIIHRYFVSFKTKFIIDNLSLYHYPNENNFVEFAGIIKYINYIFYKINININNLIYLIKVLGKNEYDSKNIYNFLVDKNFVLSKISFFQRLNIFNTFKLIISTFLTVLVLILAVPVYNILYSPILIYITNFIFGIFINILDLVKTLFNLSVLRNFDYKNYKSVNYNFLFYWFLIFFYKFKKILKLLNLRKFIKKFNSYVCNNVLSSYWEESKQPDQCSRWIKFNIFSGMKRSPNSFVDLNLKDRNSNVLEIETITSNSASERISDGVNPYSGKTLLSDDLPEYSYLLIDEIEHSNERVDAFIDFLYKHFVFSKLISNVVLLPLISSITLFCKLLTDLHMFILIKIRQALGYIWDIDADIVATTDNPIMARLSDNITILLYNLYHAFRLRFVYYFAFVYLLCGNLFCLDGVVYVGNTNFGVTWLHSPVVMGFFFLVMITRWLGRLISTDHNMITFNYVQYEKVIEIRHDKDIDDLSYRYSVLPTIILGTYYSTYILLSINTNYPHLIREDVFDRVKKVWGNYSKDYIDVSTEPLQQVSSDLISLVIYYSQFPLRELYKFLF